MSEEPSVAAPASDKSRFAMPLAAGLLLGLLAVFWAVSGANQRQEGAGQSDALSDIPNGAVVELTLRAPEFADRQQSVPWRPGQTVLAATKLAGKIEPAGWASRWRGGGAMAFLEELGGLENQGADGLNWQFEVNGEYATRGAGATELKQGDRVLWELAPYE